MFETHFFLISPRLAFRRRGIPHTCRYLNVPDCSALCWKRLLYEISFSFFPLFPGNSGPESNSIVGCTYYCIPGLSSNYATCCPEGNESDVGHIRGTTPPLHDLCRPFHGRYIPDIWSVLEQLMWPWWEPHNLHALGHVWWVASAPYRSCVPHKKRRVRVWSLLDLCSVDRKLCDMWNIYKGCCSLFFVLFVWLLFHAWQPRRIVLGRRDRGRGPRGWRREVDGLQVVGRRPRSYQVSDIYVYRIGKFRRIDMSNVLNIVSSVDGLQMPGRWPGSCQVRDEGVRQCWDVVSKVTISLSIDIIPISRRTFSEFNAHFRVQTRFQTRFIFSARVDV